MDGRSAAATLGVGPQATRSEIRRAFRARVKRAHPDAAGLGSEDAFIALRAAFDELMAAAPDEPAGPRTDEPAGPRTAGPTEMPSVVVDPWSLAERVRSVVDVVDMAWARPRVPFAPGPVAGPAGVSPAARDRRGLTFDDHLAAALAVAG